MTEERKEQIRQRLLRARYPRRGAAKFTHENEHNPLILEDCPICHGRGKVTWEGEVDGGRIAEIITCPECLGEGITGQVVPYFSNAAPICEAIVYAQDWMRCPYCGKRFSLRDPDRWTGLRHTTCGQKIRPAHRPD